jgi:hypothetical protein
VCAVAEANGLRPEFRYLEGPDWLDLRYLPRSAKQEIISVYEALDAQRPESAKWHKAIIRLLNKYMDDSYTNFKHLADFVKYMDILDRQRGTAWRTTIPDTYELLLKHCPNLENL